MRRGRRGSPGVGAPGEQVGQPFPAALVPEVLLPSLPVRASLQNAPSHTPPQGIEKGSLGVGGDEEREGNEERGEFDYSEDLGLAPVLLRGWGQTPGVWAPLFLPFLSMAPSRPFGP